VTAERGVCTNHILEAGLYRVMAQTADRVVVVTDSSKIGVNTLQVILPFEQIHTFITDTHAPVDFVRCLKERGVEVILVPFPAKGGEGK
jgi:DeoR/GlpR family transcriptional regulator of sugar metabolism